MSFFKRLFGAILGGGSAATPRPVVLDPSDSPEEQLKDVALGLAEQLAANAIQIYISTAVQRIPSPEKQLDVVEQLRLWIEDYEDILIEAIAAQARDAAEAEVGRS